MHGTHNAYLRLNSTGTVLAGPVADTPGSLVFVDLEPTPAVATDGIAYLTKQIVAAPPGFFLHASYLLLRWPFDDADATELQTHAVAIGELVSDRTHRKVRTGIVQFPQGAAPSIVWAEEPSPDDPALLARSRAVELETLLEAGGGVWRPKGYHYVLPSGEHAATFVRLADAFKRPRDASAIATWLHRYVKPGLAIVTDSPTLLPLVSALELAALRDKQGAPRVVMLGNYAANRFEIEHATAELQDADHVLGIVSVSSTGSTAARVGDALGATQQSYSLESLITRSAMPAAGLPVDDPGIHRPWLRVRDDSDLYANGDVCRLCRGTDRARVVFVDPRSFEPMVLPRPDLLMPAVRAAGELRQLWLAYDRTLGSGIHGQPHTTTQEFRSNRTKLAVRCYPHRLLDPDLYEDLDEDPLTGAIVYTQFLNEVSLRVSRIAALIAEGEVKASANPPFDPTAVDVIVTTHEDRESPGFDAFVDAVAKGLGIEVSPSVVAVESPYGSIAPFLAEFAGKHNILVCTLGAITGTTMQKLLLGLHDLLPDLAAEPQPQIAGLIMHARMEDPREWKVLQNAYTRLDALWSTPLSLASPFEDEEALLGVWAPEAALEPAAAFYERRLEFLNGLDPDWQTRIQVADGHDPWASFWGMPCEKDAGHLSKDRPRLRPGSFYGHRLRATTTFAAVGTAVQRARQEHEPGAAPVFHQFEMPAVLRSYFDPLIIVSILRWIEPHEAWWGDRPADAANVLSEAFARAKAEDVKILLPECLLAAALGKVPSDGCRWLVALASHYVWCWEHGVTTTEEDGAVPWTDSEIGPVQLGLALLRADHSGEGDHFGRAVVKLQAVSEKLAALQDEPARDQSKSTAQLLWALERFLQSTPALVDPEVGDQVGEPDAD